MSFNIVSETSENFTLSRHDDIAMIFGRGFCFSNFINYTTYGLGIFFVSDVSRNNIVLSKTKNQYNMRQRQPFTAVL